MATKPIRRVKSEQKSEITQPEKDNVSSVEETNVEETEEVIEEEVTEEKTVKEEVAKEEPVEVITETMVKVKKLNGGALYLPKKILKPGEVAWIKKADIPAAFMDSIQILEEKASKVVSVNKNTYVVQEQEDGTFWVINSETNKPISKDLEQDEAIAIAKSLNMN